MKIGKTAMKVALAAVAAAGSAAMWGGGLASAASSSGVDTPYASIRPVSGSLGSFGSLPECVALDAGGGFFNRGTRVFQWNCNGHPDQHWSLHLLNPGSGPGALYQLYNQQSGLCLSISAFSRANGVQTVQLGCQDPTATQSLWQIHPAGNGAYILQPAASRNADFSNSMCLDVRGGSTSDGTVLEQWTCNGGLNQRFYLDGGAPPAP